MDFKLMFMGDADTMSICKKKGKLGLIALWAYVAVMLVSTLLSVIVTVIGEIVVPTAGIGIVLLGSLGALPAAVVGVIPNILMAVGYQINKKIVAAIGAILVAVSAVINMIVSIVAIVGMIIGLFMSPDWAFSTILYNLSNLVDLLVPLVTVLASLAVLWMILHMERSNKISALAVIVTQAVSILASALGWILGLVYYIIFAIETGAILPCVFNVLGSTISHAALILCFLTLALFAVSIMRVKKAIAEKEAADAPIEGEAVEISEIAEEATEEAAPTAGEESAETAENGEAQA